MSNFDTVVLDGEMGLFTTIREGDLPYYTGATEVTPSDQTQTLPTADTIVTSNITINPIPDMELETKNVTYTPTESEQTDTITASSGYDAIEEVNVTVEAIDSDYVGSNVPRNDSDDLTASGATITAPAGYYENDATKTIASGSATTPATTITANPSISVGNDGSITATVSATQSVTPTVEAGYVSSGTAGTITVSGSGSSQLSTQAGTTITPTTSQQTAVAAGKFTTGAVVVDKIPSQYIIPTGTKTIDENGTGIDVSAFAAVDVAVPGGVPTLETKSVSYTPTESAQSATVTADQGYDGLEEVNISVGAISSSYVGSAIDRRDSTDLSASGATVTAPAGYYESAATKSVASGTASTPATSITANPSISVNSSTGLITATASASQSVTPTVSAGYVSSGTSGTVTVSGSATEQLTTQAAQTIHPSTTDQTIASGKYLTGAQTIKGVTLENLTAENIVSGVTVKVGDSDDDDCVASVTGTASGGGLEEKAVNFYDYDGELLYAYTAQEFLALNAFPANPTHTGLTAQGWNWTLAGAKTYVTKYGFLQIGQTYEPTDGAAHVHIQIDDMKFADFTIKCPVGWVDWGDGSGQETVGSATNKTHTYAATGNYIIRLYCSAASWNLDMPSDPLKGLIHEINLPKNQQQVNANQIMDVWNLERFTIPNGGLLSKTSTNFLRNARKLQAIILPLSFEKFTDHFETNDLKAICLNEGLSGVLNLTCGYGSTAKAVTIPDGITSVKSPNNWFRSEFVETIVFPDSVTDMDNFDNGYFIKNLRYPSPSEAGTIMGFNYALYLQEIEVPDGISTIRSGFNNCLECRKITIGKDVTNLASGNGQGFMDTRLVTEIHMKPNTPPTRSVYNFRNKPSNCTIYVPYSADHSVLAAYQSATNWSNDAALMVEEQP